MSRRACKCPLFRVHPRFATFKCTLRPWFHLVTLTTTTTITTVVMDHSEPLLLTLDSHRRSHSFLSSPYASHHCHHDYSSHLHTQEASPTSEGAASSSPVSPSNFYLHPLTDYSSYGVPCSTFTAQNHWNTWESTASGVNYAGEVSTDAIDTVSMYNCAPGHSTSSTSPICESSALSHHVNPQYHQFDSSSHSQPVYQSLYGTGERSLVHHHHHPHHSQEHISHDSEAQIAPDHQSPFTNQLDYSGEYECHPVNSSVSKYMSINTSNCFSHQGDISTCSSMDNLSMTSVSVSSIRSTAVKSVTVSSASNRVGRGNKLAPVNPSKKERRRTLSINCAFSNLRECIPNVPVDTKLSKIKTLRLATSYIAYLMNLLSENDNTENTNGLLKGKEGFKVDLQRFKRSSRSASAAAIAAAVAASLSSTSSSSSSSSSSASSSSSSLPLTSTTYRSQSSKITARGVGGSSIHSSGMKGAFHVPVMTCSGYPESVSSGAGGVLLSTSSSSVIYPSFATSKASTTSLTGTGAAAGGGGGSGSGSGGKGRTGWPEHVWQLELKNVTSDTSVVGVASTSSVSNVTPSNVLTSCAMVGVTSGTIDAAVSGVHIIGGMKSGTHDTGVGCMSSNISR